MSDEMERQYVGVIGVIILGIYLFAGTAACIIAITQMWPHPTPVGKPRPEPEPKTDAEKAAAANKPLHRPLEPGYLNFRCGEGKTAKGALILDSECVRCEERAHAIRTHLLMDDIENDPECIRVFCWELVMWNERRLLMIVMLSGMLGAFFYSIRSFFMYVGNRELVWSWAALYVFSPITGGLLGAIVYLVVRGGFFSSMASVKDTSPYAFAALAALVGIFQKQTLSKLIEIFEVIFSKANEPTKDKLNAAPVIKTATSTPKPISRTTKSTITITGERFTAQSAVHLDKKKVGSPVLSGDTLSVEIAPADLPPVGNSVDVTVVNAEASNAVTLPVEPPPPAPPPPPAAPPPPKPPVPGGETPKPEDV